MDRKKVFNREKIKKLALLFGLKRASKGAIIAGICKKLADKFILNVWIVRLLLILLTITSFGIVAVLYLVCSLLIPVEKDVKYDKKKDYIDVNYKEKN